MLNNVAAALLLGGPLLLIAAILPYTAWIKRRRHISPPSTHGRYVLLLFAPFILLALISGTALVVWGKEVQGALALAVVLVFGGIAARLWNQPMPPAH